HNAATPATCGVAMLVPLLEAQPPPAAADTTSTPGAATWARPFEKSATSHLSPAAVAPTAPMANSSAAGRPASRTYFGRALSLPEAAAKITLFDCHSRNARSVETPLMMSLC